MNDIPRQYLYRIASSILLVVLLLLVFISVSTYRNLNRERDATMRTLKRQALTLITALEAGARAVTMMQLSGKDAIGNLVHEIGRAGDVNYLYLVNAAGDVVHHSIPSLEGSRVQWRPLLEGPADARTRIRRLPDGTYVYEVAKPFAFIDDHSPAAMAFVAKPSVPSPAHFDSPGTVYLGMTMTAYETARRTDLQHAMIMGAIVLTLGAAAIYFFSVIRSYYQLTRTLSATRDYAHQVISSMVHGVLSVDRDGRVVSYNQQASLLLGMPTAAIEGLDLRTVLDFEDTGIAQTLDRGIPTLAREIGFRLAQGGFRPLMLTVTPIRYDAGGPGGAVVVLRDLTERKRLEKKVLRSEKLAAMGRLAAGVAHEIRNPLSSIRGFAALLGQCHGETTPEREYAEVMISEIDRINRVVTDLLNFARPMMPEPKITHVPDLIDHVVSLVATDAKARGIDIHVGGDLDLPPMTLDPNQITQALLNLLLNAITAVEQGGVIDIRTAAIDGSDGVRISVADNGPGIHPDIQKNVFEPFYTTRERGTGLGLAIVRKIAEIHDGGISMESPPPGSSGGTRITLRLRSMTAAVDPEALQTERRG